MKRLILFIPFMESPFAKEWDKKNNCKDTVYSIELVG